MTGPIRSGSIPAATPIYPAPPSELYSNAARRYDNIGSSFHALGLHEEALEYFQLALQVRAMVLPTDHLDVAKSYHNIGVVFDALGHHTVALKNKQWALLIQRKTLKEDLPDVAKKCTKSS